MDYFRQFLIASSQDSFRDFFFVISLIIPEITSGITPGFCRDSIRCITSWLPLGIPSTISSMIPPGFLHRFSWVFFGHSSLQFSSRTLLRSPSNLTLRFVDFLRNSLRDFSWDSIRDFFRDLSIGSSRDFIRESSRNSFRDISRYYIRDHGIPFTMFPGILSRIVLEIVLGMPPGFFIDFLL